MKTLDKRTVLIGLDGATFTILDSMMENGTMPFLKQMMASVARGELRSVIPPLTPPAWTSMITGRSPGYHGITNFMQRPDPHARVLKMITSRELYAETLYSIVNRHGLRAGSLNFPAMNPPPRIDGYVLPGWVPWRWVRRNSHPTNLIDRLKQIPGFDLQTLAVPFAEEEKSIGECERGEYEAWIQLHTRREEQWFKVLTYLMKTDPCHLTTVIFDGIDRLQHLCWRFLDEAYIPTDPDPWEQRVIALCQEYFQKVDQFIAEIVGLAGSDATILIASDHGFDAWSESILYINTWLESQGYLRWKDSIKRSRKYRIESGPNAALKAIDWQHTRAYASTTASNGIFINVARTPDEGGVLPEEYERFRQELITALRERCVDAATGEPLIAKIWTREVAFQGPRMGIAPDLTLALRDKGFISIQCSDTYLQRREEVIGTHAPDGVLIAMGPGIPHAVTLPQLSLLDVAPIILYSLDLPIPEDFEGTVPRELFEPRFIGAHPVCYGEATQPPGHSSSMDEPFEDGESQEQILMRLKALGYVE